MQKAGSLDIRLEDANEELEAAMKVDRQALGALSVRAYKDKPFYEVKWRDATRTQRKRRLGRAWLEADGEGGWQRRRGRVREGFLDERAAYSMMGEVIAEVEAQQQIAPTMREARFEDAVEIWLEHLQFEKRAKPSTLDRHRTMLARPKAGRGKQRGARIMRAFAGRKLTSITTEEIRAFLAAMDREVVSARTVNIHRQVLHSIFEHARRKDTFGLRDNPVTDTAKRPEDAARPVETFDPDEIRAITEAARAGLHREHGGYKHSAFSGETELEWSRINEQDAAFYVVAGCTGLRLGELLALHWADVDLERRILSVSRSMSAGIESSTKTRRPRSVPLADQAASELKRLRERPRFTGRNDYVFCRPDGGPLDCSAVRSRFICAQEKAGVRVRRFHDLRHSFGSLAIQKFDLVAVKDMMGHSKLTTTERYLHSKPRPDDVAKLTTIFEL
jgi:integrase